MPAPANGLSAKLVGPVAGPGAGRLRDLWFGRGRVEARLVGGYARAEVLASACSPTKCGRGRVVWETGGRGTSRCCRCLPFFFGRHARIASYVFEIEIPHVGAVIGFFLGGYVRGGRGESAGRLIRGK